MPLPPGDAAGSPLQGSGWRGPRCSPAPLLRPPEGGTALGSPAQPWGHLPEADTHETRSKPPQNRAHLGSAPGRVPTTSQRGEPQPHGRGRLGTPGWVQEEEEEEEGATL